MTWSLDLSNLRKLYADGTASPVDVVREVYKRISEKGEKPDWIALVPEGEALKRAEDLPKGPLCGVPFAVKDNIDVAGLPTTCACPEFAYTPTKSATVVRLLEAAGAILIGKTNLDQFATGLVGTRSPYGIPNSTFNSDYVSGGSSSGSAVAVADGLVSFSLGTDTAGSGRVPAGFNNIVGLKATKGWVSTHGVVPACRTLDVVSVFALTVGDAGEVTSVIAKFDPEDEFSRNEAPDFKVEDNAGRIRVGVPKSGLAFFGNQNYEELFSETITRAKSLGCEIVEFDYTPFSEAAKLLYAGPWVAERLAVLKELVATKPDAIHDVVRQIVVSAKDTTAVAAFEGIYSLAQRIREAEAEWGKMDMMLLPTAGTTYRIDEMLADPLQLNANLGTYTNFVNLMDLSALAVPAGIGEDGLPFGVTLIGRAFEDGKLASFGDKLHRTLSSAKVGATATKLSETPKVEIAQQAHRSVQVAVVGAHLTGQPLNSQLTERSAKLIQTTHTGPGYRFYALANTTPAKPGLVFDGEGAGNIEVEIWEMDEAAFGSFVALIPAPLGIGTLTLADGSTVKGFVCEAHAVKDAEDITSWGGWRAWLSKGAAA